MEDTSVTETVTEAAVTRPRSQHSLNATKVIDWPAIRSAWIEGVTAKELGDRFGVSPVYIRKKASRDKWDRAAAVLLKKGSASAVKRVIAKEVRSMKPELQRAAKEAVAECIKASVETSRALVTQVHGRLEGASLKDLSNGASALVGGVKVWREALGLGDSDSPSRSVAINLHIGYAQAGEEIDPAIDV